LAAAAAARDAAGAPPSKQRTSLLDDRLVAAESGRRLDFGFARRLRLAEQKMKKFA
jgi:hypothetical protein